MSTKYQAPIGNAGYQFCDDNGDPLGSGNLYTYATGTTTDKSTYKDSAGAASHVNPIVLGADGRVPGDALWLDNDVAYTFLLKDSGGSTVWSVDNVSPVVPPSGDTISEWIAGPAPTYIGAASFSVAGDYTGSLTPGRRLQLVDTTTLYGVIASASYASGLTTVTVTVDGGTDLTAALASFSYGLLTTSATSSMPALGPGAQTLTDAAHTLSRGYQSYQITPGATRTLTLDDSFKAGDRVRIYNLASAYWCQLVADDASALCPVLPGMSVELECISDSPADNTGWALTSKPMGVNKLNYMYDGTTVTSGTDNTAQIVKQIDFPAYSLGSLIKGFRWWVAFANSGSSSQLNTVYLGTAGTGSDDGAGSITKTSQQIVMLQGIVLFVTTSKLMGGTADQNTGPFGGVLTTNIDTTADMYLSLGQSAVSGQHASVYAMGFEFLF
jgi:hypothetical protein